MIEAISSIPLPDILLFGMNKIRIRRPDDFHVHLRDGDSMV